MLTGLSTSSIRGLLGYVLIGFACTTTAMAEVDASGDLVLPQSTLQAIQQETASTATALNNNITQAQAQTTAEQAQRQQAQAALDVAPPPSTNAPTLPVTTTTPKLSSQPLPPPPVPKAKAPTISDSSKVAGQETGVGSSIGTTPSAPTGFSTQSTNGSSGSAGGNSKWDYGF